MLGNQHDFLQLTIGSFNIQGSLPKKATYKDFKDFLNTTDITVIQESWLTKGDKVNLNDYKSFKANRRKSKKAKRGSGGLIVLYKEKYAKGITREKSSDEKHVIWIKCQKDQIFRYDLDSFNINLGCFIHIHVLRLSRISLKLKIC